MRAKHREELDALRAGIESLRTDLAKLQTQLDEHHAATEHRLDNFAGAMALRAHQQEKALKEIRFIQQDARVRRLIAHHLGDE